MGNRIERILITPTEDTNFNTQLISILRQIKSNYSGNDQVILQLSFFINSRENEEYLECCHNITKAIGDILKIKPSTCIIAQSPANGIQISLELIVLTNISKNTHVNYKEERGISYTSVKSDSSNELYAGGISSKNFNADFSVQVDECYQLMKSILTREGLTFADIVRQWNYVEGILSIYQYEEEHIQHYEVLNDVRSKYYAEVDFRNGYPAATGIGMDTGGLILEFYAVQSSTAIDIVPIKNPKQVDAYHYSEKVLIGDPLEKHHKKTTPKFERAKFCSVNGVRNIYISGTASIQSEKTLGIGNTRVQTEITLENIANLVTKSNLEKMGIHNGGESIKYTFIRVYIKERRDISVVREICNTHYSDIRVHYLIADICRDNLLLEIEGVAEIV